MGWLVIVGRIISSKLNSRFIFKWPTFCRNGRLFSKKNSSVQEPDKYLVKFFWQVLLRNHWPTLVRNIHSNWLCANKTNCHCSTQPCSYPIQPNGLFTANLPWLMPIMWSDTWANTLTGLRRELSRTVAITNHRILNIYNGKVTFIAKDYRDNDTKKPVTLDGVEFLRRFAMNILPGRFVKIRRFGIYNHTLKRNLDLQFTQPPKADIDAIIKDMQPAETTLQRIERLTGFNPCLCSVCKSVRMIILRELPRIRSPAGAYLFNLQKK